VLKATMPGVPDFYQGTELWDLSLVDPDNRRPVDFDARRQALSANADWRDLTRRWMDGHLKLALTHRLLQVRAERPALFRDGRYEAVEVRGPDADHVIAFMRNHRTQRLLVVAGRHFGSVTDGGSHWPKAGFDAQLVLDGEHRGPWRNALTAGTLGSLDCRELMSELPVAIFTNG